jgi:single-strand DNA-binding protein
VTQIAFIGNTTSEIELRYTQNGKAVGNVTVAVNRKRGETEETDFHRVTLWEGMAENAVHLDKGTRVIVIGRLTSRQYERTDGQKRTGWDVTADAFGPDLRFAQATVQKVDRRDQVPAPSQDVWNTTEGVNGDGNDSSTPF